MARLPRTLLFRLLLLALARLSFLPGTLAQIAPNAQWLVPDGSQADLTTTWNNGDSITLSWQALNASICDLWLTSRNTSINYAVRLASNIDINSPGTLPWTIDIGTEEIEIDDQFVLRFIPTGTTYAGSLQFVQVPSPGFVVLAKATAAPTQSTVATGTATTTISSQSLSGPTTASTSVSASASATSTVAFTGPNTPPSSGGGLSTGVKFGAAIAAFAALCVIIALLLWVVRLRRRVKAAANHRSQGIVPDSRLTPKTPGSPDTDMEMTPHEKRVSGLHEVQGDKSQPLEMSAQKERKSIYEMPG